MYPPGTAVVTACADFNYSTWRSDVEEHFIVLPQVRQIYFVFVLLPLPLLPQAFFTCVRIRTHAPGVKCRSSAGARDYCIGWERATAFIAAEWHFTCHVCARVRVCACVRVCARVRACVHGQLCTSAFISVCACH